MTGKGEYVMSTQWVLNMVMTVFAVLLILYVMKTAGAKWNIPIVRTITE